MLKLFTKPLKNKKGFTLTELIVVVAILGVLAAVATPSIIGYLDEAKVNADEANATTLESAVKRLAAKGTITLATDDADDIIIDLKKEIDPIPTCQRTGYRFIMTRSNGSVAATTDAAAADGSTIELKE